MKFKISRELYNSLVAKELRFVDFIAHPFEDIDRWDNKVKIDLDRFPFYYVKPLLVDLEKGFKKEISECKKVLKKGRLEEERDYDFEHRMSAKNNKIIYLENLIVKFKQYEAYRGDALSSKPRTLRQMYYALREFLDTKLAKTRWLYSFDSANNYYQPYLFTSIYFHEKNSRNDTDNIHINYCCIENNGLKKKDIDIGYNEMKMYKRDPEELLKGLGFFQEEEDWLITYRETMEDFQKKGAMQNIEFIDNKGIRYINDNIYQRESISGARYMGNTEKDIHSMLVDFGNEKTLCEVPVIPTIYLYNLREYKFVYKDVRLVEPYIYDELVEQRLILPRDHKNLIDILLSEEFKDEDSDIIKGKGNGTVILTKGEAGLGKTLTSEVYAEKKHLPRLKIHAGQLGTNENSLEKILRAFMEKAERWGCILLIDEADVYIRQRGDDVQHNAIVATLLQLIEYFNGTLFMTTNRTDSVDSAIESRCSAILKYELPSEEMSEKLWKIFAEQLSLTISNKLANQLAKKLAKLSGRDIKEITRLVSKYARGNKLDEVTIDTYILCATFRGIYSVGGNHSKE